MINLWMWLKTFVKTFKNFKGDFEVGVIYMVIEGIECFFYICEPTIRSKIFYYGFWVIYV